MKACLINGSPKHKDSASGLFLEALEQKLGDEFEYDRIATASIDMQDLLDSVRGSDVIVIAFPLYIDGLPSHLLRLLHSAEPKIAEIAPNAKLYGIALNGFYEGRQNQTALDMLRNFCERAGLSWGQGAGIGASPMVHAIPVGIGLNKNMGAALDVLASNIISKQSSEDIFAQTGMPRFLYIMGGNMGWKRQAKENGLSRKDLY